MVQIILSRGLLQIGELKLTVGEEVGSECLSSLLEVKALSLHAILLRESLIDVASTWHLPDLS